jgi:hypothetical protein
LQDSHDTPTANGDTIEFDGVLSFSATVLNLHNKPINVVYDVKIVAGANVTWEEDEVISGWSHKNDSPTYTSNFYADRQEVKIASVSFTNDGWLVDNNNVSTRDGMRLINPESLKQMLNGNNYIKYLELSFDTVAEEMTPPDPDGY